MLPPTELWRWCSLSCMVGKRAAGEKSRRIELWKLENAERGESAETGKSEMS